MIHARYVLDEHIHPGGFHCPGYALPRCDHAVFLLGRQREPGVRGARAWRFLQRVLVLAAAVVARRGRAGQFAQIAAHSRGTTALPGRLLSRGRESLFCDEEATATATFLLKTPLAPAPPRLPQPPPQTRRSCSSTTTVCTTISSVIGALPGLSVRTRCRPAVVFRTLFPVDGRL